MVTIGNSLTAVLDGDWNKLYMQPEWMAGNIFEKSEIEIGVSGQGSDFTISYRADGVIISPSQSAMLFVAANIEDETLDNLSRCLNNFIKNASTPQPFAYGLNIDFMEDDDILFAKVLDSMSDANDIVKNGYEIISTQVNRTLRKDGRILNMDFRLDGQKLKVHFNEHHVPGQYKPDFNRESIIQFIEECTSILDGLGYEPEADED